MAASSNACTGETGQRSQTAIGPVLIGASCAAVSAHGASSLTNLGIAKIKRKRRRRKSAKGYRIYDFWFVLRAMARRSSKPYVALDLRKFTRYGHINTLRGHLEYMRQHPIHFGLVVFISGDYTPDGEPKANYRWRILITTLQRFQAKKLPFTLTGDMKSRHVKLHLMGGALGAQGLISLWGLLTTFNQGLSSPMDNFKDKNSLPAVGNERTDSTGPPKQAEMAVMLTGLDRLRALKASLCSAVMQKQAFGRTNRARPNLFGKSDTTTQTAGPGKAWSFTITAGEGSEPLSITATPEIQPGEEKPWN